MGFYDLILIYFNVLKIKGYVWGLVGFSEQMVGFRFRSGNHLMDLATKLPHVGYLKGKG